MSADLVKKKISRRKSNILAMKGIYVFCFILSSFDAHLDIERQAGRQAGCWQRKKFESKKKKTKSNYICWILYFEAYVFIFVDSHRPYLAVCLTAYNDTLDLVFRASDGVIQWCLSVFHRTWVAPVLWVRVYQDLAGLTAKRWRDSICSWVALDPTVLLHVNCRCF